jgi:hypothetical protein
MDRSLLKGKKILAADGGPGVVTVLQEEIIGAYPREDRDEPA